MVTFVPKNLNPLVTKNLSFYCFAKILAGGWVSSNKSDRAILRLNTKKSAFLILLFDENVFQVRGRSSLSLANILFNVIYFSWDWFGTWKKEYLAQWRLQFSGVSYPLIRFDVSPRLTVLFFRSIFHNRFRFTGLYLKNLLLWWFLRATCWFLPCFISYYRALKIWGI